ncbi:MAG TPA: hypothetical protein VH500_14165 [Nitrososphaeraceae archaeon]
MIGNRISGKTFVHLTNGYGAAYLMPVLPAQQDTENKYYLVNSM